MKSSNDALDDLVAKLTTLVQDVERTHQALRKNVYTLLNTLGDKAQCKGCGADIWWIKTRAGKNAPITAVGLNHFADCPKADRFRKAKGTGRDGR